MERERLCDYTEGLAEAPGMWQSLLERSTLGEPLMQPPPALCTAHSHWVGQPTLVRSDNSC